MKAQERAKKRSQFQKSMLKIGYKSFEVILMRSKVQESVEKDINANIGLLKK